MKINKWNSLPSILRHQYDTYGEALSGRKIPENNSNNMDHGMHDTHQRLQVESEGNVDHSEN